MRLCEGVGLLSVHVAKFRAHERAGRNVRLGIPEKSRLHDRDVLLLPVATRDRNGFVKGTGDGVDAMSGANSDLNTSAETVGTILGAEDEKFLYIDVYVVHMAFPCSLPNVVVVPMDFNIVLVCGDAVHQGTVPCQPVLVPL